MDREAQRSPAVAWADAWCGADGAVVQGYLEVSAVCECVVEKVVGQVAKSWCGGGGILEERGRRMEEKGRRK